MYISLFYCYAGLMQSIGSYRYPFKKHRSPKRSWTTTKAPKQLGNGFLFEECITKWIRSH